MRTRYNNGYTIIEFMMALMILAVLVAIAMPSVQRGMKTQELNEATLDLMNLVDYARIQAQSRNHAYELRIQGVPGSGGAITVNESSNSRCDGFDSGLKDLRSINFASNPEYEGVHMIATGPGGLGANTFGLCFKPDGRVVQTDTGLPVPSTATEYAAGEAWIDVQLAGWSSGAVGMIHRIVIPYNGVPRREHRYP